MFNKHDMSICSIFSFIFKKFNKLDKYIYIYFI